MAEGRLREVRLERDPAALFRWLLDGVLILGPRRKEPLRITTPGDMVWETLAEPRTPDSIADELSAVFAAPVEVVRADIEPVLRTLLLARAIRVAAAPR
jgi:hypothetical protein